jgi:potassium-transporting ATPase KdpC subunit
MKTLLTELRVALVATLVLAAVCCGLYPLAVFGVAQVLFPRQSNGSLLTDADGTVRGSSLLGQNFTSARYFHSRPSSAGSGYDAANSSGSNLGPTSRKLADAIAQNVADYRQQNGLTTNTVVPADAVTASASGLDPHISPANAALQADRVAQARHLSRQQLDELIRRITQGPDWGVFGDPRVNVLELNLALDRLGASGPVSKSNP